MDGYKTGRGSWCVTPNAADLLAGYVIGALGGSWHELPRPNKGNMTFPDEIIKAAQAADEKWGISAAVTLAQWAEESDYGQRMPPDSNNPFGIKAAKGQPYVEVPTHEGGHGQIRMRARFRKFDSIAEAFDKHGELLATSKAYRKAQATDTDEDYAQALSGVYAEDLDYGKKLIAIMDAHDLYQYDVD